MNPDVHTLPLSLDRPAALRALVPPPPGLALPTRPRGKAGQQQVTRLRMQQRLAPNVPLLTQHGTAVNFYDDVVKDSCLVLSVLGQAGGAACPAELRALMEARRLLGSLGQRLQFVTLTLNPLSDPPEALQDFAQRHGVDEDWTFLTGRLDVMGQVLRALGFLIGRGDDGAIQPTGMLRVGDERRGRWGHVNAQASPFAMARMIRFELA